MKKHLLPLVAVFLLTACGMENSDLRPMQKNGDNLAQTLQNNNGVDLSPLLAPGQETDRKKANKMPEGKKQVVDGYVIQGTANTGLATGFILKEGIPVTVSASGLVGFYFAGLGDPASPNGRPDVGLINGLPAISLIAKVGDGPLQFVGAGPTQLTGSGELVFFVNDNFFTDNTGAWNIEVKYDCYPGFGFGDKNHYHCK